MKQLVTDVLFNFFAAGRGAEPFKLGLLKIERVEVKEDYRYPLHVHDWGEVVIPRRERYECVLNGRALTVEPGQMLLVQPPDIHEDFYRRGCELVFLVFRAPSIFSAQAPLEARVMELADNSPLSRLLDIVLAQSVETDNQALAQVKYAEAFLWGVVAEIPMPSLSPRIRGDIEQSAFQRRLMNCFLEGGSGRLDVARMAAKLGMSKRSLEYKFRKHFGSSPAHALTAYRIQLANQMLEEGGGVKAVAERLGFPDQFKFSTVFKRFMGFPPSQAKKGDGFAQSDMPLRK